VGETRRFDADVQDHITAPGVDIEYPERAAFSFSIGEVTHRGLVFESEPEPDLFAAPLARPRAPAKLAKFAETDLQIVAIKRAHPRVHPTESTSATPRRLDGLAQLPPLVARTRAIL
jgi:hypothetical protein